MKLNAIDRAEAKHEVYGNLDAPDDVEIFYHLKRFLAACALGLASLVFVSWVLTKVF